MAVSVAVWFPSGWQRIFRTLVAAVTVVMVFVIQHTQARHQAATQRKLDEILRRCRRPTTRCSPWSTPPMTSCVPPGSSTARSGGRHWPRTTGGPAALVTLYAPAGPATPAGSDGNGDGMGAVWPALRWP